MRIKYFIIFLLLMVTIRPVLGQPEYDLVEKGIELYNQGDREGAVTKFDEAIALNNNMIEAWVNRGIALGDLGNYNESLNSFNKAIEINASDARIWNNKGIILGMMGRYDESIQAFDEALRLAPCSNILTYKNKAEALEKMGKIEEAERTRTKYENYKNDVSFCSFDITTPEIIKTLEKYREFCKKHPENIIC